MPPFISMENHNLFYVDQCRGSTLHHVQHSSRASAYAFILTRHTQQMQTCIFTTNTHIYVFINRRIFDVYYTQLHCTMNEKYLRFIFVLIRQKPISPIFRQKKF